MSSASPSGSAVPEQRNPFSNLGKLLFLRAKRALFPGLDLHNRCRYRFIPEFLRTGPIDTLDAGCGNGALAYAAYRRGNRVLGITYNAEEVRKAQVLFSDIGTDPARLEFKEWNLYDLPGLGRSFDQIICSETLEHIREDALVIRHFYDLLRPGGVLHLCCPFALHPEHSLGRTNNPEDGGHVRDGYTLESYRLLLEPIGFEIMRAIGLGSPLLAQLDKSMRFLRVKAGDLAAVPLFLMTWPLQFADRLNPSMPFSLYVQATKRGGD